MRILYGAVGEGLGHATRSRVVAEHLIAEGHEVEMAASRRALPYLRQHLPDVEEIWGLSFALAHGEVDAWKTLTLNVRGGLRGVPADWRRGRELARSFAPDLVISDFDGFAYLFAKGPRHPGHQHRQHPDGRPLPARREDPEGPPRRLLRGLRVRALQASARRPVPDHDVLPPAGAEASNDAMGWDRSHSIRATQLILEQWKGQEGFEFVTVHEMIERTGFVVP